MVFADAAKEFFGSGAPGGGALGGGQALGMLFKALEAEQLGADRFFRLIHAPPSVGAKRNSQKSSGVKGNSSFSIVPLGLARATGQRSHPAHKKPVLEE